MTLLSIAFISTKSPMVALVELEQVLERVELELVVQDQGKQ